MDYPRGIERVYEHLDANRVENATMECLRMARHLRDYHHVAIFLREVNPNRHDLLQVLVEDMPQASKEAVNLIYEQSLKQWFRRRTLDFSLGRDERGNELTMMTLPVGRLDPELAQCEQSIQDMAVPAGMEAFDTAAFTDEFSRKKMHLRAVMKAVLCVRDRIKTCCLNYVIGLERQLDAQLKPETFLYEVQNEVNNFFKARSEDVYLKLLKASELVGSTNAEDMSLLLTQVRRAMKAAADYLYPPAVAPVVGVDGKERILNNEQYLNRLNEFLANRFQKSSSRDLLRAEFEHLSVFLRRLNDLSSKGVHAEVSAAEAKQGLLGVYLFLYNVCTRLVTDDPSQAANVFADG